MKIRNGFVTNSSSSSFIVSFKDEYDVQHILDKDYWNSSDFLMVLQSKYANRIAQDVQNRKNRISCGKMFRMLLDYYREYYEFNIFTKEMYDSRNIMSWRDRMKYRETYEYKRKAERFAYQEAHKVMSDWRVRDNNYFAVVDYGDDDGSFFSALEHEIMPRADFVIKSISHH